MYCFLMGRIPVSLGRRSIFMLLMAVTVRLRIGMPRTLMIRHGGQFKDLLLLKMICHTMPLYGKVFMRPIGHAAILILKTLLIIEFCIFWRSMIMTVKPILMATSFSLPHLSIDIHRELT